MFNTENQQGPAVQHRELCPILCNHVMVPRGKDKGRDSQGVWDGQGYTAVFKIDQITREQKKKGEKNQKTLEKVIQNN